LKEIDPTEFDLIQFIRDQDRVEDKAIVRSIGDDCAVWRSHPSVQYLVSTDLLVEEVHFRRQWISPRFLGRKAFLVNLSDLAAMGARPFCCLLSLSLPACLTGSFFEEVIAGFRRECKQNKTTLVGGDLSSGREIQISVTIIGTVESVLSSRTGFGEQPRGIEALGRQRTGTGMVDRSPGTRDPARTGSLAQGKPPGQRHDRFQ